MWWDQNSNITVECVDEDLCGPGYRNCDAPRLDLAVVAGLTPLIKFSGGAIQRILYYLVSVRSGLSLAFWWGVLSHVRSAT